MKEDFATLQLLVGVELEGKTADIAFEVVYVVVRRN